MPALMSNNSTTATLRMSGTLRVLDIVKGTSVDGPHLRTSVYVAGCNHKCHACHNPQSWDMNGGAEIELNELASALLAEGAPVTFTGGDPLYQIKPLLSIAEYLHGKGVDIWCYTGFTIEEIMADTLMSQLLQFVDVIVDGPFIEAMRDTSLLFRGSSNQRLIDVKKTIANGSITLWINEF